MDVPIIIPLGEDDWYFHVVFPASWKSCHAVERNQYFHPIHWSFQKISTVGKYAKIYHKKKVSTSDLSACRWQFNLNTGEIERGSILKYKSQFYLSPYFGEIRSEWLAGQWPRSVELLFGCSSGQIWLFSFWKLVNNERWSEHKAHTLESTLRTVGSTLSQFNQKELFQK